MAESAVLDSLAPIMDAPEPISPEVVPDGAGVVAPEAEFEGQDEFETEEPIEEIGEDDPRIARILAERDRRREQALKDQRENLQREREQAEQKARADARLEWERRQASAQGKEARIAGLKQIVQEAFETEDIEASTAKLAEIETSMTAAAFRNALDGLHQYASASMEKFGGFYMPPEWVPRYQEAMTAGRLDIACGLVLEARDLLVHRQAVAQTRKAMAESAEAEETADQKAERLRAERKTATAPGSAPVRPVANTRAPAPRPLSSLSPGTAEYRAAYRQKHGIDPPF